MYQYNSLNVSAIIYIFTSSLKVSIKFKKLNLNAIIGLDVAYLKPVVSI